MIKRLLPWLFALLAAPVFAAGEEPVLLQSGANISDQASLQRGAGLYFQYCASCHSLQYMRYSRLARDLGLTEAQVMTHLNHTGAKFGDTIRATMPAGIGDDAIGGEFFRWEYATGIAGRLLGINPFDEPNVTESKQNTGRLLAHYVEHGALPAVAPLLSENGLALYGDEAIGKTLRRLCQQHDFDADTIAGLLAAQINATNAGDYFALLAYLPMTPAIEAQLEELRRRLRHTTKRAITVGYGPRFQHSTGQLHKGGAANGIFLQITADDAADLPIPGQPYSFGVLKVAQAGGDLEALHSKGRRALRLHVGGDISAGIAALICAVELAAERKR